MDLSSTNSFGVIVHSGGSYGGHYFAELRTSVDPQWFEFNDSFVSRIASEKAIESNFGNSTCAYILFYIKKVSISEIYDPVPDELVPKDLVTEDEETPSIHIKVLTFESLQRNVAKNLPGFDITSFDFEFHITRSEKNDSLYKTIGEKYQATTFRLWRCTYIGLPTIIIPNDQDPCTLR